MLVPRDWDIGTGVRGYAWNAPSPRAAILLQHGFGEYAERYVTHYHALVPHFVALGASVYAFDLRGHGRSPGPRARTTVEQGVVDHLAARRVLAGQPLPLYLFGHSLGGLVTATSVALEPAGVTGVILGSAALQVTANVPTRAFARVVRALAPGLPLVPLKASGLSRDRGEVDAFRRDPMIHHGLMPAGLAASILFTGRDNWARYSRWTAPVLALHGTADTFTEPSGSRRFIATVGASDRTLQVVEGGYHELLNDLDRDAVLRVILDWLEQRLPRRS